MGADDHIGTRLLPGMLTDDVPHCVDSHIARAGIAQHLRKQLRPFRFLKRRSLELAQFDLIVDRLRFYRLGKINGSADRRRLQQQRAEILGALLRAGRSEAGKQENTAAPQRAHL